MAGIATFALATRNQFEAALGPDVLKNLDANSFIAEVRNFHLDRLPKYNIEFGVSKCVYCNKDKDLRSMRIDHIIPVGPYCRLRFLMDSGAPIDHNTFLSYFRDETNLLLACTKCNSDKSDTNPDERVEFRTGTGTPYSFATKFGAGLPIAKIIALNGHYMRRLRALNSKDTRFVLDGAWWNTSQRELRVRRERPKYRAEPYSRTTTKPSYKPAELDRRSAIHNVIVNGLARGRPEIGVQASHLALRQSVAAATRTKDLRLCLYCLGLFQKQAFALDHIVPIGRPIFGSFDKTPENVARYNNPANILGVCVSCNSSKGMKTLSRSWMDERCESRVEEGLAGLEDVLDEKELDLATARRNTVLGV